jgi:UDP-glucose 4-epimerase
VFHLGAYAAENMSHFVRRFNYTNNLVGSINVLNAALRSETVRRFVFSSSIAVYGEGQLPMVEALTPHPEDPYGIGKYAFELDLAAAHRLFGLDYVIFRPHNVYGELQSLSDPYRNVIGIFMNQLIQGKPMTIFGDGSQTRSFSYIDDVARIIAQSIVVDQATNEVFNIGGDTPYTVLYLAGAVARAFGVADPEIVHLEPREEVVHAVADHSKLRSVFGDLTPVPLEDGLRRMATWAREQQVPALQTFDEVEVLRALPPAWASGVRQGI